MRPNPQGNLWQKILFRGLVHGGGNEDYASGCGGVKARVQPFCSLASRFVKAIRRFTVRTVLPDELAALCPGRQPAVDVVPPRADCCGGRLWEAVGGTPSGCSRSPRNAWSSPPTHSAPGSTQPPPTSTANHRSAVVPAAHGQLRHSPPPAAIAYPPNTGSTPPCPSTPAVWASSRRPPESASDLGIPVIGVDCSTGTATSPRPCRPTDGNWSYPEIDPHCLPMTRLEDRGTGAHHRRPSRGTLTARLDRAVGRVCRCCSTPTTTTTTSTCAVSPTALRRRRPAAPPELLLGIGGLRAVRACCLRTVSSRGLPHEQEHADPGTAARHRDRGTDFDQALPPGQGPCSPPTPGAAGMTGPLNSWNATSAAGGAPGLPWNDGAGAETYPGSDPSVFNTVMGMRPPSRSTASAPCTARSAGRCSVDCGRDSTSTSAHHLHHQRRARCDLDGRRSVGRGTGHGPRPEELETPQAGSGW